MKKHFITLLLFCCVIKGMAQPAGTFNYTFSPLDGGPPIHKNVTIPLIKYKNYDMYWYANPNNGERHLFVNGAFDIGIIILDDKADTDVVYRDKFEGDQFNILGKTNTTFYIHPDNDHRPIRIHYNTFTSGELYFTFAGNAVYEVQGTGGVINKIHGTISGTFQAFREPKYEQSDKLPGCNCDPTIYAKFYNPEIGRTPSACENALLWRIFNHVQQALHNLVPNISHRENEGGKRAPGDLLYLETKATIDVTGPLSEIEPCSPDNPPRTKVSVSAAERPFIQDDAYGLTFEKMPVLPAAGTFNGGAYLKAVLAVSDSLTTLFKAGKITADELNKTLNARSKQLQGPMPDYKKMEADYKLKVSVIINAQHPETAGRGVTGSDYAAVIKHTIPDAVFDVHVAEFKDSDGTWIPNKLYIYYGQFTIVPGNGSIKSITPVYAPAINKLSIFNIIVKIEGGNDLITKALANIDLTSLPTLLDNPKTK
ncbi:hypothetical protein [Mucilaginibacter flavus]|uniref:hypothetical protein n=1 Tax=Mucilaginibacter flavus TaxID=931504 RepID=UPI0025B4E473|nr:hypothetical protein [Mucilaginibacter flavus]MDN3582451.1 hypothetical protein [Mucilaginibacter flavus]